MYYVLLIPPIGGRNIAATNFNALVQWYRHLLVHVAFQVTVQHFAPMGPSQNRRFVDEPGKKSQKMIILILESLGEDSIYGPILP